MTIRHVDRTGKPWTFEMDCTPEQGRMFERLLLTVRNIGNREELNLHYLLNADVNTEFRDGMERAVLSALKTWAEGTPATVPQAPEPHALRTEPDGDDEREPYYWENF